MSSRQVEDLAARLMARLRKRPQAGYAFVKLAREFNCEPDDLREASVLLKSWGYRLKVRRNDIVFVAAPDILNDIEILWNLKTRWLGRRLVCYQSIKSTNDIAARRAAAGAPEGTIITSEEQTKGRGRLGRQWYSPPGRGIYVSMILRPTFAPDQAPGLSIMTALALAEAIESHCPGEVKVKWPNDVLIGGRKTAGILTELSADRTRINYVIVGVGINANQTASDFPEELRKIATSVRTAVKRKINRVALLQEFLVRLEKAFETYRGSRLRKARSKLKTYSSLLGNDVSIQAGQEVISGKAIDIDSEGRLVVDVAGRPVAITAGEVTVLKR